MPIIKEYTIQQLRDMLCSGQWFPSHPMPISRHRALSQVNNPRAEPTDVVLLVSYDDDRVVGYLGILPDRAFWDKREYKIGWLTAWWANPAPKHAGVGLFLLMRAFSLYGGRVGASGFSDDAKKVYSATKKFRTLRELGGVTIFARLNTAVLFPRRMPWLGKFSAVLKAFDFVVNQFFVLRQHFWRRKQKIADGFRIEYLPEVDQEAEEFMQRFPRGGFTKRGSPEMNWIARYPWVACTPLASESSFHFASSAKSHHSFNIKIFDRTNHLIGVLMITEIDGHLTVPYCYHDRQSALIAQVLCHHLIALRLERVTTFQADVIESLSALKFPSVFKIKKSRAWVMSGLGDRQHQEPDSCDMQDGDGDCAFTI